jgi:hypothetical protein
MPKRIPPLSDKAVRALARTEGFHAVGGVAGLLLQVSRTVSGGFTASWVLRRRTPDGRRPMLGLGSAADVSLPTREKRPRA